MIYIIDHQDSFTWNVVHQFSEFEEVFCSNFFEIKESKLLKADTIVLSPGPGAPKDYPLTSKIYKKFRGKKKIIGICLGFQQILHNEYGKIVQQKNIYHGYQSKIKVTKDSKIFKKNKVFQVGRYHSLKLNEPFVSGSETNLSSDSDMREPPMQVSCSWPQAGRVPFGSS